MTDAAVAAGGNRATADAELADEITALLEALAIETVGLRERALELLAACQKMPPSVSNADEASRFADMVKLLRATYNAADAKREARKLPFRQRGDAVHGYFKTRLLEPLDRRKRDVEYRLGIWLAQQPDGTQVRGDLGALGFLRRHWTGEVLDRKALDLEALRPHLSLDALNSAVAAYAVATQGAPLEGARIWPAKNAMVR